MSTARVKKRFKPPAFQFYPGDFMTGTTTMPLPAVGAYIRLLCHQWETGGVPADDAQALARVMGCARAKAAAIWSLISGKFVRHEKDALWRNPRLEFERRKQVAFSKLQSDKGKRGGRPKSPGFTGAKPGYTPGKALRLQSSEVRTPPQPPSGRGARITRAERTWAEAIRREHRGCPHPTQGDPPCADAYTCIGKLVAAKREAEARALATGAAS